MIFGRDRFKIWHVGRNHEMHQHKIRNKGPESKTEKENREPRT